MGKNMVFYGLICIIAGFFLDLLLGDPRFLPHPVRLMGRLIKWLEERLWRGNRAQDRKNSILLVCLVLVLTGTVSGFLLWAAYQIRLPLGLAAETVLCYQVLATKGLKKESMKVYRALEAGDVKGARYQLSMLVGRDTEVLDEEGIIKAAVETVAENTSDGVIAPLFYLMLGGPVLALLYKAVNTMDSMIGYKNERYLDFGRAAAKLDDEANFLPARISALLMVTASFLLGYDGKGAFRIYKRDRRKHASPNSAQTESVCAGALGIALGGNAWYFGKLVEKPVIGDKIKEVTCEDIKRANRLLYATAFLALFLFGLLRAGAALLF